MKPTLVLLKTILALSAGAVPALSQVQTAGTLLVDLDPAGLPLGPVAWVTNSGSLGGVFQATGLATVDQPVIVAVGGGAQGIMFDGHNFMEHLKVPSGATLRLSTTPLAGNNAPCSIECWVINPTTWQDDGETMVYWGVRGTSGLQMAFCYSANSDHGATDHWGWNLGWSPLPAMGIWHHLVYTFDGTTQRTYVDGVLNRSASASYNPVSSQPITLACQRNSDGTLIGWGWVRGSLTLGKVRIHSGTLTATQVSANYALEKGAFVMAPAPLAAIPAHRYTFNNAASSDAVGATVADVGSVGGANAIVQGLAGSATFTGTRIRLAGGSSATGPYVDLPNGLVSGLSASGGGSGRLTVEGWVQVTGTRTWPRLFDFGSTTSGEIAGPGGSGNGANYFMLAQVQTYRDWGQCEVNNNGYNGGPNASSYRAFGLANASGGTYGLSYYAVTWDEATGELVVYENGLEAARFTTAAKFNHVNDVNVWLGRSNWLADDNLQGDYDEFRLYDRVLTPAEIINDFQAGPDAVLVVPGPLQALHLTLPRASAMVGTFQQASVLADYQNVSGVNVTAAPGIAFASSDTGVATVSASGLVTAIGPGTATITATLAAKSDSQALAVTPLTATLAHRYSFNDPASNPTAADSIGGATATVFGYPGLVGTQVQLDPAFQSYVQLPDGILTGMEAVTVEAWASFGAQANWCRLFDFGDQNASGQGNSYLMFTPHAPGAWVHAEIHNPNANQYANRAGALDNQANVHVAVVAYPAAGLLAVYLDGSLAAVNRNVTVPLASINATLNYVGKSLFDVDPYFNGAVDELRIYDGVLSQARLAVDTAAGPESLLTEPGALLAVHLGVPPEMPVGVTQAATVTGDFADVANVNLLNYGTPTLTSANTNVITVTSAGLLKAEGPGTTSISASFGGLTDTKSLTVVILPPVLAHRYSFNDPPGGVTIADTAGGAAWQGQLTGNALLDGSRLVLDGQNASYAVLPPDILKGFFAVTFEAWASFGPNNWWCRLYDFGDQTEAGAGNSSIFFTPHGGPNGVEMTLFAPGQNDHLGLPGFLDGQTNLHLTCVYHPYAGWQKLYYNGRLVGQNHSASLLLSAVNNTNSFIGHSLFNVDAGLNATIEEFRIYNGALEPAQIALNDAAGPDQVLTDAGALGSVRLVVNPAMVVDQTQQAQLLAQFAKLPNVNLFLYDAPAVASSATNVLTATPQGWLKAVGAGQATLTAVFQGTTYTQTVTVSPTFIALRHRYSFGDVAGSATAVDSVGGAHGQVSEGGTFDGTGTLTLDGLGGFVALPSPLISTLTNATFVAWITPNSVANWQRVFDFGTDNGIGVGQDYLFLAARGAPGARFAAKAADAPENPILDTPTPLAVGQETCVAVTYNVSAGTATLYQDGEPLLSGGVVTPLGAINDANSWLGRSQYAADAFFGGSFNEFRIYEGALTPAEIASSYAAGPTTLPSPALAITRSGLNVIIAWPAWGARFVLKSSPTLGDAAVWSAVGVPPTPAGANLQVAVSPSEQARFYRLTD
jgi:hypothetical protein